MSLPDKRAMLQPILDEMERGWTIKKPSPSNPTDVEELCIFQKADENKQVEIEIPNSYFTDADQQHKLKPWVQRAIRKAR